MYACGLRIGEAATVEIASVDSASLLLRIIGKGDKERRVPLPQPMLDDLRRLWLPSRPREFHPEPLTGRVEDWRAGVGRSLCSPLSRPFVCECHSISTMPRFQSPPRRTQRADFPLYALLFASPQGLWDLSCRGDFRP